jgi:hypothetical protein
MARVLAPAAGACSGGVAHTGSSDDDDDNDDDDSGMVRATLAAAGGGGSAGEGEDTAAHEDEASPRNPLHGVDHSLTCPSPQAEEREFPTALTA